MIRAVLILLLLVPSALTAAPVPKEIRKEGTREGVWKLLKIDLPGGGASTGMTHNWVIDAKDDVSFSGPQERSAEIRFRLTFDPAAKHCDYKTPSMATPYLGVYELDGDSLKIAIDFGGGPRPKALGAPGAYTYNFRRVKDSK